MLTKRQIEWASRHDWFLFSRGGFGEGFVAVCVDDVVTASGEVVRTQVEFRDFQALRDWAGY